MYVKLGKYKDAIADYDEAVSLSPDFAEGYLNRGVAKRNLDKYDDAKMDLQTALKIAELQGKANLKTTIEKIIQDIQDKK